MRLFKPGWMSKDENKAMRSLDRVSGDEELYRIATECPHRNVQIQAVSRIRDADRRLDVALTKQWNFIGTARDFSVTLRELDNG